MPSAETLFLVMAVLAFLGYGLVLFIGWLAVEVLDKKSPAPTADVSAVEAERPVRAAS